MTIKRTLLLALTLTLPLAGVRAAVVTLLPSDDAYLSSTSGEANQNWNTSVLEQFGYTGEMKRTLLKFDLSSIPNGATVTSAELTLQLLGVYGGDLHYSSVWRMPNDNWTEHAVTWNSCSQTGAVAVAVLPPVSEPGVRVWFISTNDWPYADDLLDHAVTFMTRWHDSAPDRYETDGYYKANSYSSKEGTVAPTLRIEYTTAPSAPPPVTFVTSTFAVGDENSGPDCVAAADVNGDGRLDLISANYGFRWANPGEPGGWNNTLTVLTNNGSGGFGSNATLTVGFGPSAVVAADVNGDGKPDLISANETDNTLTVLTNDGSGLVSAASATLAVGSRPRGLGGDGCQRRPRP